MDASVYCRGVNGSAGAVGNCTDAPSFDTPQAVCGGHRFRHISAGAQHSCAVSVQDVAFCWGENRNSQLGSARIGRGQPREVIPAWMG